MFTLTPRFVTGIRESYARDVQGRRGEGTDIGFDLSSSRGAGDRVRGCRADRRVGSRRGEVPREVVSTWPE